MKEQLIISKSCFFNHFNGYRYFPQNSKRHKITIPELIFTKIILKKQGFSLICTSNFVSITRVVSVVQRFEFSRVLNTCPHMHACIRIFFLMHSFSHLPIALQIHKDMYTNFMWFPTAKVVQNLSGGEKIGHKPLFWTFHIILSTSGWYKNLGKESMGIKIPILFSYRFHKVHSLSLILASSQRKLRGYIECLKFDFTIKKACESGFPYCFLTDFTKLFLWGSTLLDFGFLTEGAPWIHRIFKIWCHDKKIK